MSKAQVNQCICTVKLGFIFNHPKRFADRLSLFYDPACCWSLAWNGTAGDWPATPAQFCLRTAWLC